MVPRRRHLLLGTRRPSVRPKAKAATAVLLRTAQAITARQAKARLKVRVVSVLLRLLAVFRRLREAASIRQAARAATARLRVQPATAVRNTALPNTAAVSALPRPEGTAVRHQHPVATAHLRPATACRLAVRRWFRPPAQAGAVRSARRAIR